MQGNAENRDYIDRISQNDIKFYVCKKKAIFSGEGKIKD